ncbi:MAG: biotin--[acetyl-CoA-carboxylase] ligase [Cytophagaceae bacterium]
MYNKPTNTIFTGQNIIFLPSCPSTNTYALELLKNKEIAEGTIVITDEQSSGRGQRGNTWWSEPGKNLTFSIILHPQLSSPVNLFPLTMLAAVAIQDTIQPWLSKPVCIKWPNDILVGDKKVAGILVENIWRGSQLHSSVVGIGLNVQQTIFQWDKASSLLTENAIESNKQAVLNQLCVNLEKWYQDLSNGNVLWDYYSQCIYRRGQTISFKYEDHIHTGILLGVEIDGKIRLEDSNGKVYSDYHPAIQLTY